MNFPSKIGYIKYCASILCWKRKLYTYYPIDGMIILFLVPIGHKNLQNHYLNHVRSNKSHEARNTQIAECNHPHFIN